MSTTSNKGLNIALWITQVLLAAMYLMAGSTKLFQPIEEMAKMMPWVAESPAALVRFIGLSELLGGIGLLLPSLLRIQPKLTVYAAIGLATVQVLAAAFHLSRGESSVIGMNFFFLAMAVFVAWGRSKKVPIAPKSK
jgi:putative oxidoreductase